MPTGRPPKPVELKRLQGNPGKRALPAPVVMLPAGDPPPMPVTFGPVAREAWQRLWANCGAWWSPTTDLAIVERLCEAYQERANLRAVIDEEGYFARGSQWQPVTHPAVLQVRALEGHITRWEGLCHLNPSDRGRAGYNQIKTASKLDAFLSRRAKA